MPSFNAAAAVAAAALFLYTRAFFFFFFFLAAITVSAAAVAREKIGDLLLCIFLADYPSYIKDVGRDDFLIFAPPPFIHHTFFSLGY